MARNSLSRGRNTRRDHDRLTMPELQFVHLIVFDRATHVDAYIRAIAQSPDTSRDNANTAAWLVLRRAHVREYIRELKDHVIGSAKITIDRIMANVAAIAFADRTEIFDDNGSVLPIRQWPRDVRMAVDGVEMEEYYGKPDDDGNQAVKNRKYRVRTGGAKLEALELLMRFKGLLQNEDRKADGHEDDYKMTLITDPNHEPPPPELPAAPLQQIGE